jgi:hypothetical protein
MQQMNKTSKEQIHLKTSIPLFDNEAKVEDMVKEATSHATLVVAISHRENIE